MTQPNPTHTRHYKKDLPISVWLFMQGYHVHSLPPKVTWYTPDREFSGRSDPYTLGLYRGRGYVLDRRFFDPSMWDNEITHDHARTKVTIKPCSIVIAPPKLSNAIPRLARELIGLMDERESWEGTASELLELVDSGDGREIPTLPNRLSSELIQDYITDPLESYGITIERVRTSEKRTLRISKTLPSNYPSLLSNVAL